MTKQLSDYRIAVVIPCYKVSTKISEVLDTVPDCVDKIYCVDDSCPDDTKSVIKLKHDTRITLLTHNINEGVGGAMVTGYKRALEDKCDIIVKIDGDGQMDPALIPIFVLPIVNGECDYTKGNRFFRVEDVKNMPNIRIFGNLVLSFLTKISSGYWNLFDPTNGYTAIHRAALQELPLDKLEKRYFFESDVLFRLNTIQARVKDVPMRAVYADESSNLKISEIVLPFLRKHLRNFCKRVGYNYFLRDFNLASIQLLFGVPLFFFGVIFGILQWSYSVATEIESTAGTVMLSALPIILGIQFILSFLQYDISAVPKHAIHSGLAYDKLSGDPSAASASAMSVKRAQNR